MTDAKLKQSVHDYVGMDDADMLALVGRFRDEVRRLLDQG